MTKRLKPSALKQYTVRFTDITSYKIGIAARSEQHAITLAQLRWQRGGSRTFTAFSGETHCWDAELE